MKGFGERLKNLRKVKNITQSELADKLGVHLQTVSRWERDISEPDFGILGLIAETLGVSLERLFGQTELPETTTDKFDVIRFGKGIACFRKLLNESQDVLAGAVGVSSDTVSKWERGLICPDVQMFLDLAKHFNVPLSKLYFAQVEPPNTNAVSADNNPPVQNKKKIRLVLILLIASILAVAVALSVVLAVCLKPRQDSGTADSPNTGDTQTETVCNHLYNKVISQPTCTAQGYTTYTCSLCGYSYVSNYVSFTQHNLSDWIIDRQPTCSHKGQKHKQCLDCGSTIQTVEIDSLAHTTGDWIVDRQPTCSVKGQKHKQCLDCGSTIQTVEIDSLTHTMGDWIVDRQPTCSIEGLQHKQCTVCNTTVLTAPIVCVSHSYTSKVIPANGAEQGYTLYTCTECGISYQAYDTSETVDGVVYEYNYSDNTCTVKSVDENISGRVEILPEINGYKVTTIGWDAFIDCILLREIVIPDSVTKIDKYAFYRCKALQEVTIPESVTVIDDEAFCGCSSLVKVVLPSNLKRINYSTFSGCVNLQSINIPESVTVIEDLAFNNCQNLTAITLPKNLLSIGKYAFNQCDSLNEVTIPYTVQFICECAFQGCGSLSSVTFEKTTGWKIGESVVDSASLEDKNKSAQLLLANKNEIWTNN